MRKINKKEPEILLDVICEHITKQEIKAQKASRESTKYMQCVFMEDKVGKVFKGVVSSIQEYGFFVVLNEYQIEGLVKTSELNGKWVNNNSKHNIKELITGSTIRLGDVVHVVISSVDVEKKNINLSLINL
jgi:ribonuclease R